MVSDNSQLYGNTAATAQSMARCDQIRGATMRDYTALLLLPSKCWTTHWGHAFFTSSPTRQFTPSGPWGDLRPLGKVQRQEGTSITGRTTRHSHLCCPRIFRESLCSSGCTGRLFREPDITTYPASVDRQQVRLFVLDESERAWHSEVVFRAFHIFNHDREPSCCRLQSR